MFSIKQFALQTIQKNLFSSFYEPSFFLPVWSFFCQWRTCLSLILSMKDMSNLSKSKISFLVLVMMWILGNMLLEVVKFSFLVKSLVCEQKTWTSVSVMNKFVCSIMFSCPMHLIISLKHLKHVISWQNKSWQKRMKPFLLKNNFKIRFI